MGAFNLLPSLHVAHCRPLTRQVNTQPWHTSPRLRHFSNTHSGADGTGSHCVGSAAHPGIAGGSTLANVWRDALSVFVAHPISMAMCALFGFAAPIIIGRWAATQAAIAGYAWVGPVVTLHEKLSLPTTGALAIVGLFTGSCVARRSYMADIGRRDSCRLHINSPSHPRDTQSLLISHIGAHCSTALF